MALEIKGIQEITILYPAENGVVSETALKFRYRSYKWYNVRKYLQLITVIISSTIVGLEVLAKILMAI